MKHNTVGLLRTVVASAVVLLGVCRGAQAQIDPMFAPTVQWSGFSQSSININARGTSRLLISTETGNQFTGNLLFMGGRAYSYQGAFSREGSIVLSGIGTGAAFQARGSFNSIGNGNFVAVLSYQIAGTGDRGVMQLLHIMPTSPTFSPFPPGPCDGTFATVTGAMGPIHFERNPLSADARTTEFPGKLVVGGVSYFAVGTISSSPNSDGTYDGFLIALLSTPGQLIPCITPAPTYIHMNFKFTPGGANGAQDKLVGQYSSFNSDGSLAGDATFSMIH